MENEKDREPPGSTIVWTKINNRIRFYKRNIFGGRLLKKASCGARNGRMEGRAVFPILVRRWASLDFKNK